MATSGTTAFALDFTDIAEEAWERAGREMKSGYDLRTARRSMNLLTLEWQNRGINMWTMDSSSVSLVAGTAAYSLPADTIDILEAVVRTGTGTSQQDLTLTRISMPVYASIPNKNSTGKPLQMLITRGLSTPTVTVWPVPDAAYTLYYWRMRRIEDAGTGVETPDIQYRFLPALVAGLAYYIATKVPELLPRVEMLKMQYEEQYRLAAEEDREKASVRFVPRIC